MSRVKHKNICRYQDMVTQGQKLYIVMEYCDKGDLNSFIERMKIGGSMDGGLMDIGEHRIWKLFL